MRRSGLNLSDEERAAIEAMTDADMKDAAKDDPDARELTAEMLAHHAPNARLEKSKAKRQAAARALVEQARDEAAATHEREREHIGK